MAFIKGVLREELENSKAMVKSYEKALKELPEGSLCVLKRNNKPYYYIKVRKGGEVLNIYKKKPSPEEIKRYAEAKIMRKKYRNLLSRAKKQVKYLKGVLRGKEPI